MSTRLDPPRYTPVRLCSGKGAYEAIPDAPVRIDLPQAARALAASGLSVTDARVMLIVAMEPEVTLSLDGRVLVKTRDASEADRAVKELWRRIARGTGRPG